LSAQAAIGEAGGRIPRSLADQRVRRSVAPYALAAPALVAVVALAIAPLLYAVWLSFTDWSLLRSTAPTWTGPDAYLRLLSDGQFSAAMLRSAIWTLGTVAIELMVGLGLALLFNIRTPVAGPLTAVLLLPWVTPYVVVAYAWRYLLDGQIGPIHTALQALGLVGDRSALSDPTLAFITVTVISGWAGLPFMMVSLLAALRSVPSEEYEAASVDGAGHLARFVSITWPHIRATAFVMSLVLGALAFYSFDIVWLTTKGGPIGATQILGPKLYDTFVRQLQPGYAAAMGVTALVVLAVVGVAATAWMGRRR
jgi:multiple sugar transport system permease protein